LQSEGDLAAPCRFDTGAWTRAEPSVIRHRTQDSTAATAESEGGDGAPSKRAEVASGNRHSPTDYTDPVDFCYSNLNATSGSTLVARRAGMQHAIKATMMRPSATVTYVTASVAVTPNRSAVIS